MQHACYSHWLWLALALLPCLGSGCADGPFHQLAAVNPWVWKKWEEDEKFGPTYHRRLTAVRGLRATVRGLNSQQKEQLTNEMAQLVQSDASPVLRGEAIAVLGELATPSAIPVLQGALSDADKDVRIAACRAWGRLSSGESLATLAQVVEKDADVDVRLVALDELGKFQDPEVVQVLGNALDDHDPAVQFRAVQSLKSATGQNYGDSVPGWRDYVQGRQPNPPPAPSFIERITGWF